jgi:hypothetical protein
LRRCGYHEDGGDEQADSRTDGEQREAASACAPASPSGTERGQFCSVGQPWRLQSGTPPSTTWMTCRPPKACSRLEELVVERVKDAASALFLVDRKVGAGDVADEQRVAGQHRPRLVAARGVDERERGVLGAAPGRVQRADLERAE